jgi:hypothetical protein
MFKRNLRRFVDRVIDERIAAIPKPASPPQGYNPLEVIRGGMYHWVYAPCNDLDGVWIQLRTSNATQLDACGTVSLISGLKNTKDATPDEMIDMRNKMEAICKITMVNPTFDEFVKMITDTDIVHSKMRLELERIKAIDCTGMSATEKSTIDSEIQKIELHLAFLLPENTFDFIVRWALGVNTTDIKKVTEEKLLEAAILAKNGNDNPHDHLSGCFTDRDPSDLDKSAWVVYNDFMEMKAVEKRTGRKWVGGK